LLPNPSGLFIKEEVDVKGGYTLDLAAQVIRLSDDFAIPPGPDLYVALSGAHDLTLDYLSFSAQVSNAPYLSLGKLQKQIGAQEYPLPAGTDLSPYKTVVVWCQAFSVAFAAAPIGVP